MAANIAHLITERAERQRTRSMSGLSSSLRSLSTTISDLSQLGDRPALAKLKAARESLRLEVMRLDLLIEETEERIATGVGASGADDD
jgi:hypothetical protein